MPIEEISHANVLTTYVGAEIGNISSEMTFDDFISIFADQNKARLCHHLFLLCHHLFLHPEFHLHRDV